MGMFDEYALVCPSCGVKEYNQTKSGPCDLQMYDVNGDDNIPAWLAEDLNDIDWICKGCHNKWVIRSQVRVNYRIEIPEE